MSGQNGQPVVSCAGVTKAFGKKAVLRDVTFTLPAGRVVGFLGRNGEGKTTLFRMLLDIVAADSGEVSVLGRKADGSGRIRQLAGYVPERPTFHPSHGCPGACPRRALFPAWDEARATRTVKELGLDVDTKIQGASKGTLAKLAWVCATAHGPKVLILDEPTSGLDALVRDEVLGHLVKELAEEGRTILVANHRMEELAGVLDEVRPLHNGMVEAPIATETLRAEGRSLAVRVAQGTALPKGAGLCWKDGDGDVRHAVALNQPFSGSRRFLVEIANHRPRVGRISRPIGRGGGRS